MYINPSDINKKLGISTLTDLLELHLCEVVSKLKALKKVELASIFCLILNCHQTMASENLDLLEKNKALKADNEILINEFVRVQQEKERLETQLELYKHEPFFGRVRRNSRVIIPTRCKFNVLTGEYEPVDNENEPIQKAAGQ